MRERADAWKEETETKMDEMEETVSESASQVESQLAGEREQVSEQEMADGGEKGAWPAKAQQRVKEVGAQLKHTAQQTSDAVIDVSDMGLQQAASGLDEATAKMRSQAERVAHASEQAADALRQAAGNLQRLRGRSLWQDTADFVRENPSVALTASVLAGFIVGSVLQTGSLRESVSMLTGRDRQQ
jgi:hypothetical protein